MKNDINGGKTKNDSDNILIILNYIYKRNNYKNSKNSAISGDKKLYSIFLDFLENPKKLETDKHFLINYIEELIIYLKTNNNFLIPFLVNTNNLIKAYINSDLDEEESLINNETNYTEKDLLNYNKVFLLLKQNSFISKEMIVPIYSYFSQIYHDINKYGNNNQEKNKKENNFKININKFQKMIKLWKIFYIFDDKENYADSSFCSLGGGVLISFKEPFLLKNNTIDIKIKFYENNKDNVNNNYIDTFTKDIQFLNIDKKFTLKFDCIKEFFKNKNIIILLIAFKIYQKKVNIIIIYKFNNSNDINKKEIALKETIGNISNIILLKNYVGQIKIIKIKISKKVNDMSNCYSNYSYKPLPINDDNEYLREIPSHDDFDENSILNREEEGNNLYTIKIINKNLFKINYINYNHRNFNVVDYYGGIIQLLPFADLIKKLYLNEKLNNNIIENNKKKLYISFINDILSGFFKSLVYSKINSIIIKRYYLFVISILLELFTLIFKQEDINTEKNFLKFKISQDILENLEKIILENPQLINLKNKLINFGTTEFEILIKEIEDIVKEYIKGFKNNEELEYNMPFQQLYRKIMNQLFIFNRLWSNKNAFFKKELKIKFKQYNYYTKNLQRPIFYPILEIQKYYPKFKTFQIKNLYKNDKDKDNILNYNFDFFSENNIIIKSINEYNQNFDGNKKIISLKCCLIQKLYHIKGNIILNEYEENGVKRFKLIFISNYDKNNSGGEGCNKHFIEDKNEQKLCYGSPFSFQNLNYNIHKIIKSRDIIFILIREYFHRVSAIEIFTYNHKSYFFNFYKPFDRNINNNNFINFIESNIILSKVSQYLQGDIVVKTEKKQILLGYYNKKYESYMFPCFNLNYYKYFTNYDRLVFTNLFSNRSFNDIYQYPIFPMFYQSINLNRDMNQHIGFQTVNEESKKRKELLLSSYITMKNDENDDNDDNDDNEDNKNESLFNIYYSNPIFLCNFLIRVFPYSFLCIEFQGDHFDDPNRLFSSIEKSLINNLSQKSDLREMIPELFYLPELYYNINELNLGKIDGNKEIDNVEINQNEYKDFDKYEYITKLKEILENEKNLNLWIDLIFGINQKETEDKIQYYPYESYVNYRNDKKIYNNEIILQTTEFGVIPFQLLIYKCSDREISFKKNMEIIKEYNIKEFEKQHKAINIEVISFICKTNFLISKEYLNKINIINNINYNINHFEEDKFTYIFKGDIFGNIYIYKKNNINKNSKSNKNLNYRKAKTINSNNINIDKKEGNKKEILEIKKISDHEKEIKYIDCNPRLNLFVTYSLDGYINVYTFPTCKLVTVIKINDYIDEKYQLIKVVLISNPFPMIFCYNKSYMFIFTINGELINKKEKKEFINLYPCIDKSLGLIKDCIRFEEIIAGKIVNNSEIDLPYLTINKIMINDKITKKEGLLIKNFLKKRH